MPFAPLAETVAAVRKRQDNASKEKINEKPKAGRQRVTYPSWGTAVPYKNAI